MSEPLPESQLAEWEWMTKYANGVFVFEEEKAAFVKSARTALPALLAGYRQMRTDVADGTRDMKQLLVEAVKLQAERDAAQASAAAMRTAIESVSKQIAKWSIRDGSRRMDDFCDELTAALSSDASEELLAEVRQLKVELERQKADLFTGAEIRKCNLCGEDYPDYTCSSFARCWRCRHLEPKALTLTKEDT